jgi:hypothetical protein
MTERNFVADETATAKLYDGNSANSLPIDDCIEVTKVEQGNGSLGQSTDQWTEIESGDYALYPANETPKEEIKLFGTLFSRGLQNVRVTAKWGYSAEVPDDIKAVATVLVSGIINYSLNAEGEVQSRTIGRYTVTFKTEKQWQDFDRVKGILEYYKRFSF